MSEKLRYRPSRRAFLRDSTLATIGLMAAACAPGTTTPPGGSPGAQGRRGEFHGAWPYQVPPTGHWNTYAPRGILSAGIFRHLWQTTLGMYKWADDTYEYWLAESSGVRGDNYEVKLRSGIKWSDGKPFTAKDVYTTFNVGRLENFTVWTYIDRMEIKDDQTISFHISRPSSLMERFLLREIIRPDADYGQFSTKTDDLVKAGKKAVDQEWKDLRTQLGEFRPTQPLAVGPYKIDPASVTEAQLTFVHNPGGYAADRVNFEKVVVYQGETAQVTPLVLGGQVDYATHGFPLATDRAMTSQGIRIVRPPLYTGPAIYFHWEKAPQFQDVRLRYAVAHAINREESGKVTYGDSAQVQKYMAGFSDDLVPKWVSSADQSKFKPYEFSIQKAEQFMREAGYTKGADGIYAKDGRKLEFELVFPSDFADWSSAAQHAAEALTKFGIKVTGRGIISAEQGVGANNGDYAMFVRAWGASTNQHPQGAFIQALQTHNTTPAGGGMKYPLKQKLPSGRDVDLLELLNKTAEGLNQDAQKTAVTELALAFNELLPIIPLWQRFGNNPVNEKERVVGWPADSDPIYKNPDGDSFAMTLLIRGTLRPK